MPAYPVADDVSSINQVDSYFQNPVKSQSEALKIALDALKTDTSNAAALADYQARLAEYNITRNAESTSIKVVKDLAMSIIGNMR
ncbi:EscF/YscF/HrpA family type III secretion system needle major subunit [Proteus sp. WDL240414]|uniref:EscF/YscF/HrpA family type III secretion system needle major subunit n=2 Tax=Proteus TaxID=583 RepID=A0A6I7DBF7_9GAMM|nr:MULTISPECIES: EscF/YscF/HrpA family type III secretion system needle major subunit [Proteus]MBG2802475.1 EscF/YscF/HrpA family type III secretion system needle major subunit [Proteus mirabilis]MBG3019081.1 EscF/YscF/HrpA family type III secretion system needle major subunit [Proteus mirabilis]MBG3151060.1 EscF/YscF/HrpA family type III secretion system needle major subunit [Proteus mirabilis]QHN12034.1 EscF/YscF/HrpA family type III secretion system needle major subunit [Proteus columbae]